MRKSCIIILVLFLLCTACQPTPSEPFVIGKDNEQMIEKAKETAGTEPSAGDLYEALGAPRTYVMDLRNDAARVHIHGEAQVVLPDTEGLPLAYVQAARFDQEQVYAFFQALTAGKEMYDIPTATPRWYIEEQIRKAQAKLDQLTPDAARDEWEIPDLQNRIQALQQEYIQAPEEVALVPNDGTLKPYDMNFLGKYRGTATGVQAVSKPFEQGGAWFAVNNDADYADAGSYTFTDENGNEQSFTPRSGSNLFYTRQGGMALGSYTASTVLLDVTEQSKTGEAVCLPEGLTLEGYLEPEQLLLSLTPAEARQQAEEIMEKCGVKDMAVDGVYLMTNRQDIPAEWVDPEYLEEMRSLMEHQAYVIRFLRQVAGVPVESYYGISQVKVDDSGYGPEWMYEVLEVAVGDEGVQAVEWTGPLTVGSIITDKAALLPFEEVRGIFEKMLPIVYANYGADKDWDIEIREARLCLWRIFDRDSFTRGILAPVWCFYGAENRQFQPLLIVNAVDGSVIDAHQGY